MHRFSGSDNKKRFDHSTPGQSNLLFARRFDIDHAHIIKPLVYDIA